MCSRPAWLAKLLYEFWKLGSVAVIKIKKGLNVLLSGLLNTLEVVLQHLLFWIP